MTELAFPPPFNDLRPAPERVFGRTNEGHTMYNRGIVNAEANSTILRVTSMIVTEEDEVDHNVHPYKNRPYHFTNGSGEPNVHKTVFMHLAIHILHNLDTFLLVIEVA